MLYEIHPGSNQFLEKHLCTDFAQAVSEAGKVNVFGFSTLIS
jgi:hypothetical protein